MRAGDLYEGVVVADGEFVARAQAGLEGAETGPSGLLGSPKGLPPTLGTPGSTGMMMGWPLGCSRKGEFVRLLLFQDAEAVTVSSWVTRATASVSTPRTR